jgi:hypothetical protein
MDVPVSRRRVLALGIGALAGCLSNPREESEPTDTEGGSTPRPAATTARTTEPGCGTPVGQEWGGREEDPSVHPCPERPDDPDACSARAFAIGLEKHRQSTRAIERRERVSAIAFSAYTATVTRTPSGFVVSARLYFTVAGTTRTGTTTEAENTGTGSETEESTEQADWPTGIYDVAYLVTDDRQWRAVGNTEGFGTGSALRQAGSEIGCVGGG